MTTDNLLNVRLKEVRDLLGAELYEALQEMNGYDLRLYAWGLERFEENWNSHKSSVDL
jgi:hypothetical protein